MLLFDEPSTYLDVQQQLQCFSTLTKLAEAGALCVAVTHDLNLALAHCTRLMVLHDGRIAADTPVLTAAHDAAWLSLLSPRSATGGDAGGQAVGRVSMKASRCFRQFVRMDFGLRGSVRGGGRGVARGRSHGNRLCGASSPRRHRTTASSSSCALRVSCSGLLAGGALALGGGLFQAMLRDSLATPYTLGVSAGAALGAVVVLALDLERHPRLSGAVAGLDRGRGGSAGHGGGRVVEGRASVERAVAADGDLAQQHLLGVYPADLRRGARAALVFDHAVAAGQCRFGELHGADRVCGGGGRYRRQSCCGRLARGI